SEALWRTRFGADPNVLSRTILVNGVSRQIVGVMPRRFRFPDAQSELWLPLALDPNDPYPGGFNYFSVARLKPGISIDQAQREFKAVLPRVLEVSPNLAPGITTQMLLDQAKPVPVITRMRDDVVGGVANTIWMVAATAGLVLLVACANVANLILVRADGRQRELAVRAALGAGRARVVGLFFAESMVLAAIASALGLAIAAIGIRVLVQSGPTQLPRLAEVSVESTVVLFTLAVGVLVAVACSAIPAL